MPNYRMRFGTAFTLTDLVFPSFLFVVGSAMSLTMKKFAAMTNLDMLIKISTRAALIFLCGYLLYWFSLLRWQFPSFADCQHQNIRRAATKIAFCYFFASLILHYWKDKGQPLHSAFFALLAYWLVMAEFRRLHAAGQCRPVGGQGDSRAWPHVSR